ncbi:MAG: cupredoxin domain-containing protein [Chloroflexi bacterium]|nr:cupredoxin domain-containing protein [Chloroflexota bacterium]
MKALILLTVALALLAMACGSQAKAPAASVATDSVTMAKSYKFEPALIQVKVGAPVTWTNQDNFTHNVHLLDGSDWKSAPLRPGQSVTYAFQKADEYKYECAFHPQNMKGTVEVVS